MIRRPFAKLKNVRPLYLILFVLGVQTFINAISILNLKHYPPVLIYNPTTNLAEVIRANRDGESFLGLLQGAFLNTAAMATGSHPWQIPEPDRIRLSSRILDQWFSPETAKDVQGFRESLAKYFPFGAVSITYNSYSSKDFRIEEKGGGYFFEAFFNQTITVEGRRLIRTFYVRALGNLAPATPDNPYNVKFTAFQIREVEPKTQKE